NRREDGSAPHVSRTRREAPRPPRLASSSTDVRRASILATITLFLALAIAAGVTIAQRNPDPFADLQPTIILISFDGFRWDYPSKVPTPHLRRLMARG